MSGQWEIVGKKKDRTSKLPVPKGNGIKGDNNRKQHALNGVNIEDVLHKSQLLNLYESKNKENVARNQEKKNESNNAKKVQKKTEKPQEQPKAKPPKNIESALNSIDVAEFKNVFERIKNQYPDGQIVWLRELVQYLNVKINVDIQDPVFSSKPVGYPLNVVPSDLKAVIERSIREAGPVIPVFFGIALTTLATDMSKNLSCVGTKIYLQCMALNNPHLHTSVNNLTTLLNSYQNRPNIGLSILWSIGHVSAKNADVGLTIYREYMFPLLEMKNYARYIVKYLLDVLNSLNEQATIAKEDYFLILDTVYSNKKNFPTEYKQKLIKIIPTLKPLLLNVNNESYKQSFNTLFKKLTTVTNNKPYQNCLCDIICDVFNKEPNCLNIWESNYKTSVEASAVLLSYIGNDVNALNKSSRKVFITVLEKFQLTNEKLSMKKKKDDGFPEAVDAIKKITEKLNSKKRSGFSIRKFVFIITFLLSTLIVSDIAYSGSWTDSNLRRVIVDSGACTYVHLATDKVKEAASWTDARIEENFPGYKESLSVYSEPYTRLFRNLGVIVYNVSQNAKESFTERFPVVIQSIENYAPGVVEQSQKAVSNIWSTSVVYVNRSVDYLKTEVFVGQLSPENVQRVVMEAYNTTQQKATEYYHWLYEKVQTSIK